MRHKCTLKGLRRITEAPPKLPDITDALLANEGGGHALLQRHQAKVSKLTREETSFLQAQHRKYKQRLNHGKRVHQCVDTVILAAGLEGCGNEMGMDLRVVRFATSDSATVAITTPEQGQTPAAPYPRSPATRPHGASQPADVSCAQAVQQPRSDVENLRLAAARERRIPSLALGCGPLVQLCGQGSERCPERCGRVILPSLCGDR